MNDDIKIPDAFLGKFNRLMMSVPAEMRSRTDLRKTLLMYFKLGGGGMAQLRLDIAKIRFPTGPIFSKSMVQKSVESGFEPEDPDFDESEDESASTGNDADSDTGPPAGGGTRTAQDGPEANDSGNPTGFFVF